MAKQVNNFTVAQKPGLRWLKPGFGREISVALAIKLLLLFLLWWLFFAGQKQTINDDRMAAKIFGDKLNANNLSESPEKWYERLPP